MSTSMSATTMSLCEGSETEKKSKSITDGPTYRRAGLGTARDACASKKIKKNHLPTHCTGCFFDWISSTLTGTGAGSSWSSSSWSAGCSSWWSTKSPKSSKSQKSSKSPERQHLSLGKPHPEPCAPPDNKVWINLVDKSYISDQRTHLNSFWFTSSSLSWLATVRSLTKWIWPVVAWFANVNRKYLIMVLPSIQAFSFAPSSLCPPIWI